MSKTMKNSKTEKKSRQRFLKIPESEFESIAEKKGFRLCTFNVHMFMNSFNENTTSDIFEIIEKIDSDVVFL